MMAWIILGVNNAMKLPQYIGFDMNDHWQYVKFILEKHQVPIASDGWQMFHPPLYYFITAGWSIVVGHLFCSPATILAMVRFIPLLCGMIQVQLVYKTIVCAFPKQIFAQVFGTLLGGLLPMNIYISQAVGNEPLAGVLSSAAIVNLLYQVRRGKPYSSLQATYLGLLIGLALLTKTTAILLMPLAVLVIFQITVDYASDGLFSNTKWIRMRAFCSQSCFVFGAVFVVSGWYYLRNWVLLGMPFVGGWDTSRGIHWWQDPGYRLLSDFGTNGVTFSHPVFAALSGFWDSLYSTFWFDGMLSGVSNFEMRPPWNYTPMLACVLWSILPTGAILVGFIRAVVVRAPVEIAFCSTAVGLYVEAMLCLYLVVPIYSTAKASYTIGATPCYAVLGAAGIVLCCRSRILKALSAAGIVCWAISAYAGYLIL